MKRDESYIQSLCESYLTMRHIPYLHLTTAIKRRIMGRFYVFPVEGMTGYPDLIIFLPKGRVLLVELKSEKGKLSDDQKRVFPELEAKGHLIFIVRSFEAFKELIGERGIK
jgi:hypothetical protein